MSINDYLQKINSLANKAKFMPKNMDFLVNYHTFVILVIIFTAIGSFGLGRLYKIEQSRLPVTITSKNTASAISAPDKQESIKLDKKILASKNGAKYYFEHCSGAKRIAEENRVWFSTELEAKQAGYTIAANCKRE